jgi:hypothetical protein
MKKFCVLFLSQKDWNKPYVVFVDAESSNDAYVLGLEKIGYTEEDVEEIQSYGNYSIKVKEVE